MGRQRVQKGATAPVVLEGQLPLPGFDLGTAPGAALARVRALGLALGESAPVFVCRAKRFAAPEQSRQLDDVTDALIEMACTLGEVQGDTIVDGPLPTAPVPVAREFLQTVAALEGQPLPDDIAKALVAGQAAARAVLAFVDEPAPDAAMPPAFDLSTVCKGAVHHHVRADGTGRLLVRFQAGDGLVGWALDAHRASTVPENMTLPVLATLAKRFDVDGGRLTTPVTAPASVAAQPLAKHAAAWLDVVAEQFPEGEPGAGLVAKVADITVELGLQAPSWREYFVSSAGGEFCGTLRVAKRGGTWRATLAKAAPLPAVLMPGAPMPPKGVAALPVRLREMVPVALRYWLYEGAEAQAVRNALTESGTFTAETVRMVGGEYGVVEKRWFLASPPAAPQVPVQKATGMLAQAAAMAQACGVEFAEGTTRLRVTPPTMRGLTKAAADGAVAVVALEGADLAALSYGVAALARTEGDFIAVTKDSPIAREALAHLGQPFAVRDAHTAGLPDGLAFVTSLRMSDRQAATWLTKEFAPEGDTFFEHAKAWCQSRGLLDKDSDYDGMLGEAVLRMAKLFSAEGHSGMSAQLARAYFNFVCDAWDGMNTMMLSDADYAKARDALTKAVQRMTKEADLEDQGARPATKNPPAKTVEFGGITVRVDRPKGFIQTGDGPDGPWARTYSVDYGYFPGTDGGDGEGLDVFLGPEPAAELAYWVRQVRPDGQFDEWKVMLGFPNELAARMAYSAHIPVKWFGGMSAMPVTQLAALLGLSPDKLGDTVRELRKGDLSVADLQTQGGARQAAQGPFTVLPTEEGKLRTVRVGKADEERYVLGVVLQPETVDSQGDVYSAEEVRNACFLFMEQYRNMGLQHEAIVNGRVRILENYIAKQEETFGEEKVPAGTWMMAVRVVDDRLWESVKSGALTGFSIGGSAIKRPIKQAKPN